MAPEGGPDRLDRLSRRRLLATTGAVAATAGLAGCGGVTDYEFSADPVAVPPDEREELGYVEAVREPLVAERSGEVGGVEVEATVESRVAVYEPAAADDTDGKGEREGEGKGKREDEGAGEGDDERDGEGEGEGEGSIAAAPNVGAVSTPPASVMGRSFNPLARLSLVNLITSQAGSGFLQRAGLDEIGHSRSAVAWDRGPTLVDDRAGSCLGESGTVESYAGLLGGDPPTAAYVHVLRVEPGDVLLAAAVHGRDVDRQDAPFVGDDGYLSRDGFDAAAARFADVCGALAYE